ncbi:MAG TPA: glycoside hydrolase family 3 C-terminal domain-containing protein [Sphingomicrobium sp.]|nr:glycoside hydrolase family 3 C-terminal domain-containing protein [Sphingomicrobium sp.]
MARLLLLSCAAALVAATPCLGQGASSIDERIDSLIGRMTLSEKAAQLQDSAPAIPRLGIPAYTYWNEALHGVARAGEATVFPQAIGMAATWDKSLLREEGEVISIEARAKYNQAQRDGQTGRYFGLTFWSPNINIFRDPRWGRGQETLGEDPYLTGVLATEFIRGVQGEDPSFYRAIATSKHFAVHSGPEPSRHEFDVKPSPRDLWETYLPAFRRTVVEGKVASIMCAYNSIDGQPACANDLLERPLRKDWGFSGYVVSDCGAIDDISAGHRYRSNNVEAVAASVKAGTDLACVFKNEYLDIPKAVAEGLLSQSDVDRALHRLLAARARLGILQTGEGPFSDIPYKANHSSEHRELALQAAREAIVLLKNDGILPLRHVPARIAVVGPGATSLISLEGNYNGTPTDPVLPLDGIRAAFPKARIGYSQGSTFAQGTAVPVPRSALPGGLTATFFKGADLQGQPIASLRLRELDLNWNWIAPAKGVDPRNFSVRFSGMIKPPAAGEYRFEFQRRRCDSDSVVERYTIRIEGAEPLEVDAPCSARDAAESPSIALQLDNLRPRKLIVEYSHRSKSFAPAITFAWRPPAEALRDEAVALANRSDLIIAFVGLNAWLEGEEMPVKVPGFEGGDRTDIRLPRPQSELLGALETTGKPVVIVLQSGSAVSLGEAGAKARAILEAWYGGERGGQAIADVISGAYNPSGRLPVTFYAGAQQLPPFDDYSMKGRTYRYSSAVPEYPFGHGLSYSKFSYSNLELGAAQLNAGEPQAVSASVRNDSAFAGDEVVQLYVATPGRSDSPLRSLKGFQRIHLAPGERRTVHFQLSPRDLAFANTAGTMVITPGRYEIWLGGGQPRSGAAGQEASFSVQNQGVLEP